MKTEEIIVTQPSAALKLGRLIGKIGIRNAIVIASLLVVPIVFLGTGAAPPERRH